MAKAYSQPWFGEKAATFDWIVVDYGARANGHWMSFSREGVPVLRLAWFCDIGGPWKFLTGSLNVGLPVSQREAWEFLQNPSATLEALRVKHHKDVHHQPPGRVAYTGAVNCCGRSWVVQHGNKIAVCPKCGRQPLTEEVG